MCDACFTFLFNLMGIVYKFSILTVLSLVFSTLILAWVIKVFYDYKMYKIYGTNWAFALALTMFISMIIVAVSVFIVFVLMLFLGSHILSYIIEDMESKDAIFTFLIIYVALMLLFTGYVCYLGYLYLIVVKDQREIEKMRKEDPAVQGEVDDTEIAESQKSGVDPKSGAKEA